MRLSVQLPKLMDVVPVNSPYFNHVDMLWSLNVTERVNNPVKEILQNTDRIDWSYSGPSLSATVIQKSDNTNNYRKNDKTVSLLPSPKNTVKFSTGLNFYVENLDAIISNTMPLSLNKTDEADFERERKFQKILFSKLITFVKSTGSKYDKLQDDFTNDISDKTDNMAIGVLTKVTKFRNVIETHLKKIQITVVDSVVKTGNVVVDGIDKTENIVTNSISNAENFINSSVGQVEHFVVTGVNKVENTVTSNVGRAENCIVVGVEKTENFVNSGLDKTHQAVGNTLDTTFKSLNKMFWFLK